MKYHWIFGAMTFLMSTVGMVAAFKNERPEALLLIIGVMLSYQTFIQNEERK